MRGGGIAHHVVVELNQVLLVALPEVHLDAGDAERGDPRELRLPLLRVEEAIARPPLHHLVVRAAGVVPEEEPHLVIAGVRRLAFDRALGRQVPVRIDQRVFPVHRRRQVDPLLLRVLVRRGFLVLPPGEGRPPRVDPAGVGDLARRADVGDERRLDDRLQRAAGNHDAPRRTPRQRRYGLHLSGAEAFIRVRKLHAIRARFDGRGEPGAAVARVQPCFRNQDPVRVVRQTEQRRIRPPCRMRRGRACIDFREHVLVSGRVLPGRRLRQEPPARAMRNGESRRFAGDGVRRRRRVWKYVPKREAVVEDAHLEIHGLSGRRLEMKEPTCRGLGDGAPLAERHRVGDRQRTRRRGRHEMQRRERGVLPREPERRPAEKLGGRRRVLALEAVAPRCRGRCARARNRHHQRAIGRGDRHRPERRRRAAGDAGTHASKRCSPHQRDDESMHPLSGDGSHGCVRAAALQHAALQHWAAPRGDATPFLPPPPDAVAGAARAPSPSRPSARRASP